MLTVYKLGPAFELPDASPFVVKLETWLRMASIPYRTEPADMRKAPKGKVPYVADGERLLGDSSLIIDYLKEKHGDRLKDARLTPAERGLGRALKSMFEADLYFIIVYLRWWNDEDFETYRPVLVEGFSRGGIPRFAIAPLLLVVRRRVRANLEAQGIGRHAREEVYAMGRSLIESAADLLGDKPYFTGDAPSSLEASAYGMLTGILGVPFENPIKACAAARPNLVGYCERIRETYWAGGPVG